MDAELIARVIRVLKPFCEADGITYVQASASAYAEAKALLEELEGRG
jgi:hypothetical protein